MAAKSINLLPKELLKKDVSKSVLAARQISYGFVFIFFLVNAVFFGVEFYFNQQLSNIERNQSQLKNNIVNLEETEQRLILTKDRIQKIDNILNNRQIEDRVNLHSLLINNLPQNVFLESQEIDTSQSKIELVSTNSKDLVNFMASLYGREDFTSLALENMSYNPFTGYKIILEVY